MVLNGLDGIVSDQSGRERERNRKTRSFRQQTDRVGGPWAHLQCMLPCIRTTAIQQKDAEKENLDR